MHSRARHRHTNSAKTESKQTKGLVLDFGWRYDLQEWYCDTFLYRGKLRELRQRTITFAALRAGETVLDVGCGTGTLAIEAQKRVGVSGNVVGIDPGERQIAHARSKAARRNLPVDFQVGVIERLTFPDQSFDVVLSTIMFHHISADLQRRGLAEISRVLKDGGRLVVADFNLPEGRQDGGAHFGGVRDLRALIEDVGFSNIETDEMPFPQVAGGVRFVSGRKSQTPPAIA